MSKNPADDIQTKLVRLLADAPKADISQTSFFKNTSVKGLSGRFRKFILENFKDSKMSPLFLNDIKDTDPIHLHFDLFDEKQNIIRVAVIFITSTGFSIQEEIISNIMKTSSDVSLFIAISALDLTEANNKLIQEHIFDWGFNYNTPNLVIVPAEKTVGLLYNEPESRPSGNEAITKKKPEPKHKQPPPLTADHGIHMLADMPVEQADEDLLGFGDYADAIAGLIDHPKTSAPLTLAINAKWGTGKTSLANLIRRRLENKLEGDDESPHQTYWFNAWMHDDANDLGAAFMADIVRSCDRMRPWYKRMYRPLPTALCDSQSKRFRRFMLASGIFLVAFILMYILAFNTGAIGDNVSILGTQWKDIKVLIPQSYLAIVLTLMGTYWLVRHLGNIVQSISSFINAPAAEANFGSLGQVRKQLHDLIQEVTPKGSKFVVFIDDLERCRPPRAIDVLEVVNQLLDCSPVVTIAIADMPAIAAMAEIKYDALARRYDPETTTIATGDDCRQTYGRLFLQKFIQLQFDLPEMTISRKNEFILDILDPTKVKNEKSNYLKTQFKRISYATKYNLRPIAVLSAMGFMALATQMLVTSSNSLNLNIFALGDLALLFGLTVILVALLSSSGIGYNTARKTRFSKLRKHIDSTLSKGDEINQDALAETYDEINTVQLEQFITERKLQFLGNDSEFYKAARDYVLIHLPPHPRNIKRILNRLRLMLFLLNQRELLNGKNAVPPKAIGKWVLLQEKWPELEKRIRLFPYVIDELERAMQSKAKNPSAAFINKLKKYAPNYSEDTFLIDLLMDGNPLAPSIKRITLLQA
ncbi:MAG: hypothetical protein COB46_08960 [Rhodospirillaceae bacterium]|nr:MAG: hypothetical protein COB46_08960 [Rhodospirillaceae bacterium]